MRRRNLPGPRGGRRRVVQTVLAVVLAVVLASGAACGVAAESEPQAVTSGPPGSATPARPHSTGIVRVYLVRDGHLVPVPRNGRSAADAVTALVAGPTGLDADAALRSPLPDTAIDAV